MYVTGYYSGTVIFDSNPPVQLTSAGSSDVIIGRVNNTTGNWTWVKSVGSSGADRGLGIASNNDYWLLAVGYLGGFPFGSWIDRDMNWNICYDSMNLMKIHTGV